MMTTYDPTSFGESIRPPSDEVSDPFLPDTVSFRSMTESTGGATIPELPRGNHWVVPVAIRASVVLLLLSAGLIGLAVYNNSLGEVTDKNDPASMQLYAQAIERVLERERKLGFEMSQRYQNLGTSDQLLVGVSHAMTPYIYGLRATSMSGCPKEFQQAFLGYIHAWESLQQKVSQNEGIVGFFKAFLTGYTQGAEGVREVLGANDEVSNQLLEAWHRLEEVSQKYIVQ